ncbi:hypothetical protein [Shewanella kaireitica]|uniref:hypothetical protein n=1 Tax=Shewanella kaireitica TaxID=212021 RepID=UPI00200E4587|nr:hypothetical protein [Shewanella kaireitica]MCL1093725.1 hypothetical protein [Shewanella kaireitica]
MKHSKIALIISAALLASASVSAVERNKAEVKQKGGLNTATIKQNISSNKNTSEVIQFSSSANADMNTASTTQENTSFSTSLVNQNGAGNIATLMQTGSNSVTSEVFQRGVSNTTSVNQSDGSSLASSIVTTTGDGNSATVTQSAVTGDAQRKATATISQGDSLVPSDRNLATISQTNSAFVKSTINQNSSDDTASITAANSNNAEATITQNGTVTAGFNQAFIVQTNADSAKATLTQTGNSNFADAKQDNTGTQGDLILGSQNGDNNQARASQNQQGNYSNNIDFTQAGNLNDINIDQTGSSNTVESLQLGNENTLLTSQVGQEGNGTLIVSNQIGNGNKAETQQSEYGSTHGNDAIITQLGDENSITVTQSLNANRATISQLNSDNSTATVKQTGGHLTTITQTGHSQFAKAELAGNSGMANNITISQSDGTGVTGGNSAIAMTFSSNSSTTIDQHGSTNRANAQSHGDMISSSITQIGNNHAANIYAGNGTEGSHVDISQHSELNYASVTMNYGENHNIDIVQLGAREVAVVLSDGSNNTVNIQQ